MAGPSSSLLPAPPQSTSYYYPVDYLTQALQASDKKPKIKIISTNVGEAKETAFAAGFDGMTEGVSGNGGFIGCGEGKETIPPGFAGLADYDPTFFRPMGIDYDIRATSVKNICIPTDRVVVSFKEYPTDNETCRDQ